MGQKGKMFNEKLLEAYWNCLIESMMTNISWFCRDEIKEIIKKITEINQNWLLQKVLNVIKVNNETEYVRSFLSFASGIRLKVTYLYSALLLIFNFSNI